MPAVPPLVGSYGNGHGIKAGHTKNMALVLGYQHDAEGCWGQGDSPPPHIPCPTPTLFLLLWLSIPSGFLVVFD